MKFEIKSIRYWNKPLEEAYPALKFYKFEQKSSNGSYWTEYWGEIELDTMEELISLENNLGEQLIVSNGFGNNKENEICIYDDYIE